MPTTTQGAYTQRCRCGTRIRPKQGYACAWEDEHGDRWCGNGEAHSPVRGLPGPLTGSDEELSRILRAAGSWDEYREIGPSLRAWRDAAVAAEREKSADRLEDWQRFQVETVRDMLAAWRAEDYDKPLPRASVLGQVQVLLMALNVVAPKGEQ
jgi:hypothetical protein